MLQMNLPSDVSGEIHTKILAVCGLRLSWAIFLRWSIITLGTLHVVLIHQAVGLPRKGVLLSPAKTLSHLSLRSFSTLQGKCCCHTVLSNTECPQTIIQFGMKKNLEKNEATSSSTQQERRNSFGAWFSVREIQGPQYILGLAMWHILLNH